MVRRRNGKRDAFPEDDSQPTEKEREADAFAVDRLIPPHAFQSLVDRRGRFSTPATSRSAAGIGIVRGMVVGRLQHDGRLPVTRCSDLKLHFKWA